MTSVISGSFDTDFLGALDGSLGFLLGGLGGSLGLTSGALGCSSVSLGGSLGLLLDALEALVATDQELQGVPKRCSNNIRVPNVDFLKMQI